MRAGGSLNLNFRNTFAKYTNRGSWVNYGSTAVATIAVTGSVRVNYGGNCGSN